MNANFAFLVFSLSHTHCLVVTQKQRDDAVCWLDVLSVCCLDFCFGDNNTPLCFIFTWANCYRNPKSVTHSLPRPLCKYHYRWGRINLDLHAGGKVTEVKVVLHKEKKVPNPSGGLMQ